MKKYARDLFRQMKWAVFGQERHIKRRFRGRHGYELNLVNPGTFSEKIQWIKIYGRPERFSQYVDKYAVRDFVEKRIGEDLLCPLIGIHKKTREIDFESLPDSFVMKATHGSGWNIIVKDKRRLDWSAARKKMDVWLRSNYYRESGERNYRPLKGRILIEKYIEDPSGDLRDYKFFCFHGEPRYIQVDGDRYTDHRRDIYDISWNKLPVKYYYENLDRPALRPEKLDAMLDICRKLSRDFAFVRVDLYFTAGRIFFGELTFTPENGFKPFTPVEYDRILGEQLDLKKY